MYHKILVPLDGSLLSEAALAHLPHVAGAESEVLLLRVMDITPEVVPAATGEITPVPLVTPRLQADEAASAAAAKAFSDAEEYLAAKVDAVRGHVRATRTLVVGDVDPASAIAGVAGDEGVDLILISTHGRSGIVRWVLGSVAEKVLRSTHAPLLLIRPGRPVA